MSCKYVFEKTRPTHSMLEQIVDNSGEKVGKKSISHLSDLRRVISFQIPKNQ